MAVLDAEKRRSMPKSDFAGPGKSFPVSDPTHARMAISGATRSEHAGNISKSEEDHIKSEARSKLHGSGDDPHKEHRVAIAKMHPAHVHQLVQEAQAGKHGTAARALATQAMGEGDGQAPPGAGRPSPFSDNDQDDQEQEGSAPAAPASRASMF